MVNTIQAIEGYLENGRLLPIGTNIHIAGRRKVIMTVLDDPTFVEPPEIPLELNLSKEIII